MLGKKRIPNLVWDGSRKHTPRRFLMRNKVCKITKEEAQRIKEEDAEKGNGQDQVMEGQERI